MPAYTQIRQGNFVGTGNNQFINLRNDIDWLHVYNLTTLAAGGAGTGVEFHWLRGFPDAACIEYQKLAADESMVPIYNVVNGFTLFDDGADALLGAPIAITGLTGAAPPVTTLVATAGLHDNDVVRFINVPGAQQFGGIDFTIDTLVANTSFETPFAPTIVATGAVAGFVRRVNRDHMFYPRHRYISSITQAANAVVELTVAHDYNVGEIIRMQVPPAYDMVEMNGLQATILAIDLALNTITLDIDSTAFTAFVWPLTADVPFTPAQTIPLGDSANTSEAATRNLSNIGIELAAGVDGPAGVLNDVIFWVAGKSFEVDI